MEISTAELKKIQNALGKCEVNDIEPETDYIWSSIFVRWQGSSPNQTLTAQIKYEPHAKSFIISVHNGEMYPIGYTFPLYKEPEDPNKGYDLGDMSGKIVRILSFLVMPYVRMWSKND